MAAEPTSNTYISKIKVGNTTYDIKNTTYSIDTSAGNVITLTGSDGTSVTKTLVLPKITIAASQIDSSGHIIFTAEQGEILTNENYDTVLVDASALGSGYAGLSPIVAHKQSKTLFGLFFTFETIDLDAKFTFYGIYVSIDDSTTPYTYTGILHDNGYVTTSTTVNGHSLLNSITLTKSDIGLGNVDNTADVDKSVASATKATQDANGNVITTTYATKSEIPTAYVKTASVSGNELTLTDASGNSTTFSPSMESAVSSVNGKTGAVTLSYTDVGAQVAGNYQAAGNYISYTNATADVAGTSKTVSKTNPQTLFVPNGLIMGGTAAAAGLTTRGICGVTTPNSSTGACAKDNLYLNYDSDSTYQNGRKVVLGAGGTGDAITGGAYTYCAVRGDEMVSYVTSKISGLSSSNQKVKTDSVTFGDNDIIQITAGDNITVTGDATNDKITIAADLSGYATETWVTNKGYTTNTGTVTSVAVKMNGTTKGPITSSGTIDLGTVITAHQDISGKVDANSAITGATKAKITYYSKGLVTAGADLTASDIPSLSASKITSGTFADARIESASTWNAKQSALSTTQLNACNSGITSTKVSTYDGYATTIAGKQDAITSSNKLAASLVSGLSTVATSGSYSDLTNKPTIDSSLSTTSTNAVQNSIVTSAINSKADSSALGDQVTYSYSNGTLTITSK